MSIGKNIKRIRKLKGMSQQKLSVLSGVPRVSISRYENGERIPTIDIVKKISRALSIKLEILVSWTDILNYNPNVIDFLEELSYGFDFLEELALFLGTTPYSKALSNLFAEDFSDKTLFLKTAKILELTDMQLYNWVLRNHIIHDLYHNKETYIKKYSSVVDDDRLNYMITSNKANLDIQPFDELFYNGVNDVNKAKIQNYFENVYNSINNLQLRESLRENVEFLKEYGDKWSNVVFNIESNPKFLLNSILKFLEEKNDFYSGFHIDLFDNKSDNLEYLTDSQINSIVNKIADLVEYEIYKIEKENQSKEE